MLLVSIHFWLALAGVYCGAMTQMTNRITLFFILRGIRNSMCLAVHTQIRPSDLCAAARQQHTVVLNIQKPAKNKFT